MSYPEVSIIIPTFNRAALVGFTLDSVIEQTFQNWECIVVDDGSTDNTLEILAEYELKDRRIRIFTRDRHPKGAPVCRNIGLDKAQGDYIIYLDSDDILAPFCLTQRVTLFSENRDCQFLAFKALLFSEDPTDAEYLWNVDTGESDLIRFLRMDALWQTTGPIYRRAYLIKMSGFKEDLPFWQDFDLHLRCLFSGDSYKKYFDHPPDYYIRTGRTDTISRSTPFTGKREILDKRITFYLGLIPSVYSTPLKDNIEVKKTVYSVLYFLCAQYLVRYSQPMLFIKSWKKVQNLMPYDSRSFSLSLLFALLIKLSLRYSVFRKPVICLGRRLIKIIPDYFVMNTNKMEKVKFV